jgi:hypothetical protein
VAVEALPFVNWVFWAGLGSGTALVVGLTELLGGTTRGYRLLIAWLLVAVGLVLLLSELALPDGAAAAGTTTLRRPLAFALAGSTVVYLLLSLANRPRAAIAILAGAIGLAALVTLAVAGGTRSAPLFAGQLVLAALALGAVNAAMLLGHWYLVTPRLSPTPLRRMMWMLIAALGLQLVAVAVALLAIGTEPLVGALGWLTVLRVALGLALPIAVTVLALFASRAASLQASTGLLYVGLALVMAGSIAGTSLSYLTGVPV